MGKDRQFKSLFNQAKGNKAHMNLISAVPLRKIMIYLELELISSAHPSSWHSSGRGRGRTKHGCNYADTKEVGIRRGSRVIDRTWDECHELDGLINQFKFLKGLFYHYFL